jgi:hypothetical protein
MMLTTSKCSEHQLTWDKRCIMRLTIGGSI